MYPISVINHNARIMKKLNGFGSIFINTPIGDMNYQLRWTHRNNICILQSVGNISLAVIAIQLTTIGWFCVHKESLSVSYFNLQTIKTIRPLARKYQYILSKDYTFAWSVEISLSLWRETPCSLKTLPVERPILKTSSAFPCGFQNQKINLMAYQYNTCLRVLTGEASRQNRWPMCGPAIAFRVTHTLGELSVTDTIAWMAAAPSEYCFLSCETNWSAWSRSSCLQIHSIILLSIINCVNVKLPELNLQISSQETVPLWDYLLQTLLQAEGEP